MEEEKKEGIKGRMNRGDERGDEKTGMAMEREQDSCMQCTTLD